MDAITIATLAALIASREVAAQNRGFGVLVYKPDLKAVVEVGAPLSEVSFTPLCPESDFDFEPSLTFRGRTRVTHVREIELPPVEWDY